jgi:competence protein ComEA
MKRKLQLLILGMVLAAVMQAGWAATVNINHADAGALAEALVGVGPVKAQAIVADRQQNGPFEKAEDLTRVRGIGDEIVARNRDRIQVSDSSN